LVADLFRGLFPFLDDRKSQIVAMPIMASGDQGYPKEIMLRSILRAASHWFARGLAIGELKIVERNAASAKQLAKVMADFKSSLAISALMPTHSKQFDVFLSFSTEDRNAADCAKVALSNEPSVQRVFDFRFGIDQGSSWQEEIDRAISSCSAIIAILSPAYFRSPECREELMQARLRNKHAERTLLFPVYWRSSQKEFPLWLRTLNYDDCRESDYKKLTSAVAEFAIQ
jgi:hypothetical protein